MKSIESNIVKILLTHIRVGNKSPRLNPIPIEYKRVV